MKTAIVRATGSNLTLIGKKLSVEAARWLSLVLGFAANPIGLGEGSNEPTVDQAEVMRRLEDIYADPIALRQLLTAAELGRVMSKGSDKVAA